LSIIAVDTASQVSSVAVISEERVAAEISMQGALTHSETLMPHIETALRMARVKKDELAGVAVSIGPGSFTGLRIGLAAAKMMSYALRIPMVGVPTLEALAYHCMWEGVRLVPMMDAQKGSVYTEEFAWTWESGKPVLHSVCPLRILPRDALVASLAGTEKTVLLLGGAVVIENVFSLPGLGRLLFQSIANRDLPVVRNGVLLLVAMVVVINFLVDVLAAWIDPRLRARVR